jgi:hypothetical protein
MSETSLALERMTDAGKFEEMVTAVLRRARAEYRGLIHTGRNAEGKTVRAPVDGIYRVLESSPPHFVIVHHTTSQRSALRGKWLSTTKQTAGDVVKALRWAEKQRRSEPEVRITLVLTCNRIPPEDLVADVGHACVQGGIIEDIWDLSRLQDFLDIDRDGQWIRKEYLDIEQERLSVDLLRNLSERSYADYIQRGLFGSRQEEWVPRSMDSELQKAVFRGRGGTVTFLVSGSGLGKSTAACRLFREHLERGGFGLWLEPEVVRLAPTVETAIEATLRGLHPLIETGCGAAAVDLVREQGELLLVIDDINKATAPAQLLEKIAGWDGRKDKKDKKREVYRIVCPAWPQVIGQASDSAEKVVPSLCFFAGPFSPEEGSAALLCHAELAGIAMTDLEARELSERLGHDPLLISFWSKTRGTVESDGTPISAQVIEKFLRRRLEELSIPNPEAGLAEDYKEALLALARRMLEERALEPSWQQVSTWFRGSGEEGRLRRIASQREIVRLDGETQKRHLAFRHDRLRDLLLAQAFQGWMAGGEAPPSLLAEPYYAEVLGQALLLGELDLAWASRVAAANPLALFYAFRIFRQPVTEMEQAVVEAMRHWIRDVVISDRCVKPLRWAVDWLLAEIDSPLVLELTEGFPSQSFPLWEARMRNGSVEAAAEYACRRELFYFNSRQALLIRHAMTRFGSSFVRGLAVLLESADSSEPLRTGALYVAGHVAEPELEPAIARCWAYGEISTPLLTAFLWAGMHCCNDPAFLLDPMLAFWSTLPEETSPGHRLPNRTAVSGYGLDDAIGRVGLKDAVVRFLLPHAKEGPLAWPIFIILRKLDNPEALEFCLRDKRGWDLSHYWYPMPFRNKTITRSRDRLRRIWEQESGDPEVRRRAFELWTYSTGAEETGALQAIVSTSPLYQQALQRRAELGDRSCAFEIVSKLETDEYPYTWWFYCHRIWSEPIRDALEYYLEQRGQQTTGSNWDWKETNEDWETSALISQISPMEAEELLAKNWLHLRFSPRFVQSALYVGTPRTRALAAEAIAACPDPPRLFEHLNSREFARADSESTGGSGLSLSHLESLAPYLNLLDKEDIEWLASACNRQGQFGWRRELVDPLLSPDSRRRMGLWDEDLFADLDDFVAEKRSRGFVGHWLEMFPQRGDPEDRAMKIVAAWLRARGTLAALEVAAECVALGGARSDLALLKEDSGLSAEDPQLAKLLDATRFRVFRRSLA